MEHGADDSGPSEEDHDVKSVSDPESTAPDVSPLLARRGMQEIRRKSLGDVFNSHRQRDRWSPQDVSPSKSKPLKSMSLTPEFLNPISNTFMVRQEKDRSTSQTMHDAKGKNVVQRFIRNATDSIIGGPVILVTGVLQVRFSFDKTSKALKIHVDKARGLKAKGPNGSTSVTNPYVKTYLISKPKESLWKRKTKIVQRTTDPVFAEDLSYVFPAGCDLRSEAVLFVVSGSRKAGQNEFLGQAIVPVGAALDHSVNQPIELRLLPHSDSSVWSPTCTKTNVVGAGQHLSSSSLTQRRKSPIAISLPDTIAELGHDTIETTSSDSPEGNSDSTDDETLVRTPVSNVTSPVPQSSGESIATSTNSNLLSTSAVLSSLEANDGSTENGVEGHKNSISTLEMALSRPEASLVTGQSYALNCQIEDCDDLPVCSGDLRERYFTVSAIIEGHKDKTNNIDCSLCDDSGRLPFDLPIKTEWHTDLVVPFKLSTNRKMPCIQLRLSHVRPHFKQEVGRATVALSTIPIYATASQATIGIVSQPPADIYMHKPKMKRLPPGVKQRKSAHVCHLKVKLWLTKMEQVIHENEGDEDAQLFGEGEIADIDDEVGDIPSNLPDSLEWVLVDEVVDASVHKLNNLLFDENSHFMKSFTAAKGYSAVSISPWDDDGKRQVSYTSPKSLIKQYRATEEQEYTVKSSGCYVISVRTLTPDAPYGNTFEVMLQFKLTANIDKSKTHLEITAEMKWLSNPYMKRMVRNGAKDGLVSTYKLYLSKLNTYINKRKNKPSLELEDEAMDTRSIGQGGGRLNSSSGNVFLLDDTVPTITTRSSTWDFELSQSQTVSLLQLLMLFIISYQLWVMNTLLESQGQYSCP